MLILDCAGTEGPVPFSWSPEFSPPVLHLTLKWPLGTTSPSCLGIESHTEPDCPFPSWVQVVLLLSYENEVLVIEVTVACVITGQCLLQSVLSALQIKQTTLLSYRMNCVFLSGTTILISAGYCYTSSETHTHTILRKGFFKTRSWMRFISKTSYNY